MDTTETAPLDSTIGGECAKSFSVVFVHPEERIYPIQSQTTLIGRSEDAAIQLTGNHISRRHATLHQTPSGLLLRDEGSRNKARCNLLELPECRVSNNDVIRIGEWVGVVVAGLPQMKHEALFRRPGERVLVGPRSRALWDTLEQVAARDLAVVIEGESGTGKDVVARALHGLSGRTGNFVAVNCAAQPEGLFEAQFFGHVRGAFTGAVQAAEGYFASAHRGTLFLDELIELTPSQQAKVLRVVEERKVTKVGSTRAEPLDVRIVSAAQRSLATLTEEGRFRPDLYARLAGLIVKLPPLRERREEIVGLFKLALEEGRAPPPTLTGGFVEQLCVHPWPLNVRELVTAAQRCRALHGTETELSSRHARTLLESTSLRPGPPERFDSRDRRTEPPVPSREVPEEGLDAETLEALARVTASNHPPHATVLGRRSAAWFEKNRDELRALTRALAATRGNLSKAARDIGISRQRAQRLLEVVKRLRSEE